MMKNFTFYVTLYKYEIQLELKIQVEFQQIHESSLSIGENYLQNPSFREHANSINL